MSLLFRSLITAEKKVSFLAALRVYCLSLTQMSACRKVFGRKNRVLPSWLASTAKLLYAIGTHPVLFHAIIWCDLISFNVHKYWPTSLSSIYITNLLQLPNLKLNTRKTVRPANVIIYRKVEHVNKHKKGTRRMFHCYL